MVWKPACTRQKESPSARLKGFFYNLISRKDDQDLLVHIKPELGGQFISTLAGYRCPVAGSVE